MAGARMIRLIEEDDPTVVELLKQLYPHSGKAFIIGITGSPGVGKSTLIDALIQEFRTLDKKIAVIAVDPTSPYTGGAILGDRLRMQRHGADKNVFIRSMASRGHGGGLSRATKDAVIVLDAMGYDIIIIETVGAGQGEFEIAGLAHSTGIVSIPGTGDGIQAVKAGMLETGDVFIVNKSDKSGADESVLDLKSMISLRNTLETDWKPRVLKTIAQNGTGVKEVVATFLAHLDLMKTNDLIEQKQKGMEIVYFRSLLKDLILKKILIFIETSNAFSDSLNKIQAHETDPLSAAEFLTDQIITF
jgi:LAO/AO transport system kinase